MQRRFLIVLFVLLAAALALRFALPRDGGRPEAKEVSYAQILSEIREHPKDIAELKVIRGATVTIDWRDEQREDLSSLYPDERSLHDLVGQATSRNVTVEVENPPSTLLRDVLISVLPYVLFLAILLFVVTRAARGGGLGGVLKPRDFRENEQQRTTFADVAGLREAQEEIAEIVEFLENPEKFQRMGAKVPRGVLLVGPPGTGKTLLARATAGESGAAFYSLTGSDFVEVLAGLGAGRVRDLFRKAKKEAPAIVFIDEIDAVGRARSSGGLGGHEEREQTLNQLLSEMDGFNEGEAVVVMAATNRPDVLDAALLRPGRFDRQINVDAPDRNGREEILRVHADGKPIDDDLIGVIARRTPGFTGAELANLLNEAALLAARRDQDTIDQRTVSDALDRVVAGLERRNRVVSDREREITAYHEVGHALCAHFGEHRDPVHKISIISRGRALGFTMSGPEQERVLETRETLRSRLVTLMGGRAAECRLGVMTSGASDDLNRATALARQMVTRFGMSDRVGPRVIDTPDAPVAGLDAGRGCSPQLEQIVDDEVERLCREALEEALNVLAAHSDLLEALTRKLIDEETIEQDEFLAVVDEFAGGIPERRDPA